jgi:hypothetical protein
VHTLGSEEIRYRLDEFRCSPASDGLPLLTPTSDSIAGFVGAAGGSRDLGLYPPLFRRVSVDDVAFCANIAGCAPAHMPVLIAAVMALGDPVLNLLGVATTTGTAAVGLILHGSCASAIGANSGPNCLGPTSSPNGVLGRTVALIIRHLLGSSPGSVDMATMGQPGKYTFCFAEQPSPWSSALDGTSVAGAASAVTVFAGSGTIEVVDTRSASGRGLLETLASALPTPSTVCQDGEVFGSGHPIVLIPPEWAQKLAADGWTRADAARFLYQTARLPTDQLSAATRAGLSTTCRSRGDIGALRSPESIMFVVAGGPGTKGTYIPTWQGSSGVATRLVRRRPFLSAGHGAAR